VSPSPAIASLINGAEEAIVSWQVGGEKPQNQAANHEVAAQVD
jgi:hypothetical protein